MGHRIALLTEKFPPSGGGLAADSERMVALLRRGGHEVVVLTPSGDLPPGDHLQELRHGISVLRFGVHRSSSETLQEWADVAALAKKKFGIEIFHALHASFAAWVAVYTGRCVGVPAVVSMRGADLDSAITDSKRSALVMWALEHADSVCAPSHDLGRRVCAVVGGDRAVYLTPRSVDGTVFRRSDDAQAFRDRNGLAGLRVIGFAGEAKKRKGLVTMLKALARLGKDDPLVRLLLVGALKREDAHLVAGWRKANPLLEKAVILVPWKPAAELAQWYGAMDALVLAAQRTAGAGSVVEAMACETPVIVADVPGLRGVVKADATGTVVPPRDDAALAGALQRVFREQEFRVKTTTAARAWVLAECSPEKELESLQHAYDRALGKGEKGKTIRFEVVPGQR